MRQSRVDDILDRLTSRRFLLCVVSLVIFSLGYAQGHLSFEDFSKAILAAVTAYSVSEGASDFASNWHSSPDSIVRTTVNANTDASPEVKREKEAKTVAARPKRVRKPKAAPTVAVPTDVKG